MLLFTDSYRQCSPLCYLFCRPPGEGIWKVLLDPVGYGGPYHLVAHQAFKTEVTNIHLEDVLFGDVWLCGGQSNMEMTVSQVGGSQRIVAP